MRWRHASFWRSERSTPIGAIARGLNGVSGVATAPNLGDDPHRAPGLPAGDVLDGVAVEDPVAVLGHVPDVWGEDGVGCMAERVVERQRLDAEDVEGRAAERAAGQRVGEGDLVDDRAS